MPHRIGCKTKSGGPCEAARAELGRIITPCHGSAQLWAWSRGRTAASHAETRDRSEMGWEGQMPSRIEFLLLSFYSSLGFVF